MDGPSHFERHKIAQDRIRKVDVGHSVKDKENPQTRMVPEHFQLRLRPPVKNLAIQPIKAPNYALSAATPLPKIILQLIIAGAVLK